VDGAGLLVHQVMDSSLSSQERAATRDSNSPTSVQGQQRIDFVKNCDRGILDFLGMERKTFCSSKIRTDDYQGKQLRKILLKLALTREDCVGKRTENTDFHVKSFVILLSMSSFASRDNLSFQSLGATVT
jgi:hypothetical protein